MSGVFNQDSRKKNAMKLSSMGLVEQLVSNLMAFIYRTAFIYLLSAEYLGINGLFTNIIQVFSLTELGIGSVITYRLYQPIKENDIEKTAALVRFYRRFYMVLAGVIILIGSALMPVLPYIIKDASELPADVNLYVIYMLYVFQSASSYLLVSNQILLDADQKGYIRQAFQLLGTSIRYIILIVILFFTRNFTLVLVAGILWGIVVNACINLYIRRKYHIVFQNKGTLKIAEIKSIFCDTMAMMCHRVGAIVVTSTDNIVMSMYVGTLAVGIYSNYCMIIQIVQNVMNNLLGGFTSSIGNYNVSASKDDNYRMYQRLRFANLWICSFCTCSLFILLNPFIKNVWGGEKLLFSKSIVVVLCINFFIFTSRVINGSFGNAVGLFVYDRIRPLIEATLNLVISVLLARKIGILGIFIGTTISSLLTVWWREPYLLHKKIFHKDLKMYYVSYVLWVALTLIVSWLGEYLCSMLPDNLLYLPVRFFLCVIGINMFYVLLFHKNENFVFYKKMIMKILKK